MLVMVPSSLTGPNVNTVILNSDGKRMSQQNELSTGEKEGKIKRLD